MTKPNHPSTTRTNHKESAPRPRTGVRAGKITVNHGLRVRSKVRAGKIAVNHGLRVRAAA